MIFKDWLGSPVQQFLDDYRSKTKEISHWIRSFQGVEMGLDVPNAQCHAVYPNSVYLYEIVARGGRGSDAMKMIIDLADQYHVIIEGHIQAMDDKRRDNDWLEKWYEKFGFKKIKQEAAWGDDNLWHIARMPH